MEVYLKQKLQRIIKQLQQRYTNLQNLIKFKMIQLKELGQPYLIFYMIQELKIMQKLNYSNFVTLIESQVIDNIMFIVMEYCEVDLRMVSDKFNRLNEKIVKQIAYQLLNGLAILHNKNIIHRDIKLENILIKFNSPEAFQQYQNSDPECLLNCTVKFADFGLSKQLENQTTQTDTYAGSDGYFGIIYICQLIKAPEIYERKQYTMNADIFSIGTLLYQLLFKDFPFNYLEIGFIENIKQKQYSQQFSGQCSQSMQKMIEKMLEYSESERRKWIEEFKICFADQNTEEIYKAIFNKFKRINIKLLIKKEINEIKEINKNNTNSKIKQTQKIQSQQLQQKGEEEKNNSAIQQKKNDSNNNENKQTTDSQTQDQQGQLKQEF